ncbi:RHS repeat-associated core domain-containing protein, partial [Sulfurirhabdus autotrophica]
IKVAVNLRFPGQYYDQETGLHYNYFRNYDPGTGRYTTSDPIGLAGGSFSTYTYVDNDPLSYVDPDGLDREVVFWSPLPHLDSLAGHVSSRGGNGENNSFGPEGWDKTYPTADAYIARQTENNKRVGLGVVVELNSKQDAKYDKCMAAAKSSNSSYNKVTNNCTSSAQTCLINAGIQFSTSILPGSFQQELLNSGSVRAINWYKPPK